jgi:Co/Zn/Cd efflux system component
MYRTEFIVQQMDCPSEEQLIRIKLQGLSGIYDVQVDIPSRKVTVFHDSDIELLVQNLDALNLKSRRVSTVQSEKDGAVPAPRQQRKVLWIVLLINVLFFVLELGYGLVSSSMGLVADSLDMLADAAVYGMALLAVGGTALLKMRMARWAGYVQCLLAVLGLLEVLRRFWGWEEMPTFQTMMVVSLGALIANCLCLYLLQRQRSEDVHMRASLIFTSNDILINLGVLVSGMLVYALESRYPDLLIGALVFLMVANGAFRILKLAS